MCKFVGKFSRGPDAMLYISMYTLYLYPIDFNCKPHWCKNMYMYYDSSHMLGIHNVYCNSFIACHNMQSYNDFHPSVSL